MCLSPLQRTMHAIITPQRIELPPGAVLKLLGSWQDYLALSEQLGDRTVPRIKYRLGEILLMAPLPEHGRKASLIADIVKVLLDHLEQRYDSFTPITMKLPEVTGIEPDYSFYIENWKAVVGKNRIDWESDPPPDIVIEIDVTSYTDISDYLPYKVPEIWLLKNNQIEIYRLQGEVYTTAESRYYPNISEIVQQCLQIADSQTTSDAIRWLRKFLQG